MNSKEFRIETKIKNNLIYQKIIDLGFNSVSEFCRKYKLNQSTLGELINLKKSALDKNGNFSKLIYQLTEIFNCLPEELFSEFQMNDFLKENKHIMQVAESEFQKYLEKQEYIALPDLSLERQQTNDILYKKIVERCSEREIAVIGLKFGLEDGVERSLREVGKIMGVSTERVRQILMHGLRKVRFNRKVNFPYYENNVSFLENE